MISRFYIRLVIILALLSLIGFVISQVLWMKKTFENEEREFNEKVHLALNCVIDEIQSITQDSAYIHSPVKQISDHSFVVQMNDTVHPFLLENLLITEFERNSLEREFDYGIYDCFIDDSIIHGGIVRADTSFPVISESIHSIKWDKDGHYFGVTFPNQNSDLSSVMDKWALSTTLLIIFVLFLSYALFVILKQKRMSEVRNDFINNMTHELKTPISTISLSSEVLLGDNIKNEPERIKQYAEIIYNENQRLKRQVEKVLQIASLDKDDVELKNDKIDLHEIIRTAVGTLSPIMEEKNGTIELQLHADHYHINGDQVHVTNVIHNLIDNAIKYSEGEPLVKLTTENCSSRIKVNVHDNGIGMEKEQLKLIFDKFYRVPTGNIHDVKGFGLGLYYVNKMVKAHGGNVQVESVRGLGSTFSIEIPIDRS